MFFNPEPPVRFVRPRKTPSKVEKATGESVVLDCEVSRASANVTWKKNGEEVEESTNISLLGDGVSRQLTIHCVTPEDAGQYVCDAKDDLMDFTLTIKGMSITKLLCLIFRLIAWMENRGNALSFLLLWEKVIDRRQFSPNVIW